MQRLFVVGWLELTFVLVGIRARQCERMYRVIERRSLHCQFIIILFLCFVRRKARLPSVALSCLGAAFDGKQAVVAKGQRNLDRRRVRVRLASKASSVIWRSSEIICIPL